jgi:hypothetical protein
MEVTLRAAYIALQIGPFIALLFALPYTVYGYVRNRIVDVWKCTYLYTFCLYFLCAYFVTWLPLPTEETLAKLKPMSEFIQLVPFQSFLDIERQTLFRDLAIILFNVALTMPLGYFLKELFHVSLKKAVLAGFLLSLLYEVTQLTGTKWLIRLLTTIYEMQQAQTIMVLWPICHNHNEMTHAKPYPSIEGSNWSLISCLNSLLFVKQYPTGYIFKGNNGHWT